MLFKLITKRVNVIALSLTIAALWMPSMAQAQWVLVGNMNGCLSFNAVVKKVGNRVYSSTKTDCRWSAQKSKIKSLNVEEVLWSKPIGGGGWLDENIDMESIRGLFLQASTSNDCEYGSTYREYKNTAAVGVFLTDSHSYGNFENWRTRRTLPCLSGNAKWR